MLKEAHQGPALVAKCDIYDCFIMVALWNRADHYIFAMWFLSSSFFFFFLFLFLA